MRSLNGLVQRKHNFADFPIKAGPLRPIDGKYAYLVLTQALKQPTLVLARDPAEFDAVYRDEVEDYLRRFGYWRNALTGGQLHSANWTKCARNSPFYEGIDGDDDGGGQLGQFEGKER